MEDPPSMKEVEPTEDLEDQLENRVEICTEGGFQEVFSIDEFRGEIDLPVGVSEIKNAGQVGMAKGNQGGKFVLDGGDQRGIRSLPEKDPLQGHFFPRLEILCEGDDSGAATTQFLLQEIAVPNDFDGGFFFPLSRFRGSARKGRQSLFSEGKFFPQDHAIDR